MKTRGGTRVDHWIGVVDPWVYPAGERTTKNGTRLLSSPEMGITDKRFLRWSKVPVDAIDLKKKKDGNGRVKKSVLTNDVIEKYSSTANIIIKCADKNDIPHSDIVAEDLGTVTNPVKAVMEAKGLPGMRVTQFVDANPNAKPKDRDTIYRGSYVEPKHWIALATHDNPPSLNWVAEIVKDPQSLDVHAQILSEDLKQPGEATKDRIKIIKKDPQKELFKHKIAELYASPAKNVLIMFFDLFGMDKPFNVPQATTVEEEKKYGCWRLRVPNNFVNQYFDACSKGLAANIPEVILMAMKSKDEKFIEQHKTTIDKLAKLSEEFKKPETAQKYEDYLQ